MKKMRKYTYNMKVQGELAMRSASDVAQRLYESTDPLTVYEYRDAEDQKRYAYTGCLGEAEGLTFEELVKTLEEIAREIEE